MMDGILTSFKLEKNVFIADLGQYSSFVRQLFVKMIQIGRFNEPQVNDDWGLADWFQLMLSWIVSLT